MKLVKLNMRNNLSSIDSKKVLVNINKKLGRSGKTFVRTTSKKADFSRIHTVRTPSQKTNKESPKNSDGKRLSTHSFRIRLRHFSRKCVGRQQGIPPHAREKSRGIKEGKV